jgi:gas vesicle protein
MGYVRGFVHGTVAGVALGLCVAPQTGDKTRAQVSATAKAVREGAEVTLRALQRVAPVASGAVHAVESLRHRNEPAPEGNGTVRITNA